MLQGKQKIWFLVDAIAAEREITVGDTPILLHPQSDLASNYSKSDFIERMRMLEDANVAKLLNNVPTDQTYGKYQIELLPGFDQYLKEMNKDPDYLEWSGKKQKARVYFNEEKQVDFADSKDVNKDKYISVGQIEELLAMPDDERQRIEEHSLTHQHLNDLASYKKYMTDTSKAMKERVRHLANRVPSLVNLPSTDNIELISAPLPNYEAQTVDLLTRLVDRQKEEVQDSKIVLNITYTSSRQVVLNGIFELAHPQLDSANDLIFSHLYQNSGKTFSKSELEVAIGRKITKTLYKVVENLGFKGDLAKAFFSASQSSIVFRNSLSRDDLNDLGLGYLKLR